MSEAHALPRRKRGPVSTLPPDRVASYYAGIARKGHRVSIHLNAEEVEALSQVYLMLGEIAARHGPKLGLTAPDEDEAT